MSIRIHECYWIEGGCQVTFSPDSALETFRAVCERHGWRIGGPNPIHEEPTLTVLVVGPTEEGFHAALEQDPAFTFCSTFSVPDFLP